jgi:hypothetical protein
VLVCLGANKKQPVDSSGNLLPPHRNNMLPNQSLVRRFLISPRIVHQPYPIFFDIESFSSFRICGFTFQRARIKLISLTLLFGKKKRYCMGIGVIKIIANHRLRYQQLRSINDSLN